MITEKCSMSSKTFNALKTFLFKKDSQEQLSFFYWRMSCGRISETIIIDENIPFPIPTELIETGNVAYKLEYLLRILKERPSGAGIGLIHNHFTTGKQEMSSNDVIVEQTELAPPIFSITKLPLIGLTMGSDGFITGRKWEKSNSTGFSKTDIQRIKVLGNKMKVFDFDKLQELSGIEKKDATISVWGSEKQKLLESFRIGIVGLGSVGSIVVEILSRTGVSKFVLVDDDKIETRNLDRTLNSTWFDARLHTRKTKLAKRTIRRSGVSGNKEIRIINKRIENSESLSELLDCDFIFSCVDKYYPRYILNFFALSHLIPVIDGGISIKLPTENKRSNDIYWRMHIVTPNNICLYCNKSIDMNLLPLEIDGQLDDPKYFEGLDIDDYQRQNVFAFSNSCASHEVLQFLGYSLDNIFISGNKPQMFFPLIDQMFIHDINGLKCSDDCLFKEYRSTAHDLEKVLVGK